MTRDARTIRAWALAQGIEMGSRGRLSRTIIDMYEKAHQADPNKCRIYRWPIPLATVHPWRAVVGGRVLVASTWDEALQLVKDYQKVLGGFTA